jgi:hypothetical protein
VFGLREASDSESGHRVPGSAEVSAEAGCDAGG